MYFIGYHGTSEASALNILSVGIQARFLPPTGQIGPGFYVAKMNGTLPQWGADWATERARSQQSFFVRMVSRITGEMNNPLIGNDARRTILKIYSLQPLLDCKWGIMNPGNLEFIKAALYGEAGTGLDLEGDSKWLQMVVPPEKLKHLVAVRDDGVFEQPRNWLSKECPF